MNTEFKNFLVFIITIIVALLWLMPVVAIVGHNGDGGWGALYILIGAVTFVWGSVVYDYLKLK